MLLFLQNRMQKHYTTMHVGDYDVKTQRQYSSFTEAILIEVYCNEPDQISSPERGCSNVPLPTTTPSCSCRRLPQGYLAFIF